MDRFRLALLAGLWLAITPAWSASHWLCNLSDDGVRLICLADPALAEVSDSAPAIATTAVVNGTRFPLDTAQIYTVDLWSPPSDGADLAFLARATICYRSPDCSVSVAPSPWTTAQARPAGSRSRFRLR